MNILQMDGPFEVREVTFDKSTCQQRGTRQVTDKQYTEAFYQTETITN